MISVDLKTLLSRLNMFCTSALHAAAGFSVSRTHYEVTAEHFLSKVIEDTQCDVSLIFRHFNLDPGRLKRAVDEAMDEFNSGNSGKPAFSPLLLELFQDAWLISSIDLNETQIRSGAVLLAMISKPAFFGSERYETIVKSIKKEALLSEYWAIVKNSSEERAAYTEGAPEGETEDGAPAVGTALQKFTVNFTEKAQNGEIDPVFGRDREIRQMIDILSRRRKNNPIIVGEAGVGKTAVVEGFALRIVEDDVPDELKGVIVLGLDMGLLEAGAGVKGEFENRLKNVIKEVKSSPKPIIMFIDEAHTMIGAGGQAGGGDAANLLKPALARGELRTIAATTWSEYKKYFEKDPALTRRFQLVKLDEPSVETTIQILRGLKEKYEEAHKVAIRDDAIIASAEMANRYIIGRQLPDKAVDLLDTSGARVKIGLSSKPDALEDKERAIQSLLREKQGLLRDRQNGAEIDEERLAALEEELTGLQTELDAITARWETIQSAIQEIQELRGQMGEIEEESGKEEQQKKILDALAHLDELQGDQPLAHIEVDTEVICKVVSDWTGIPLGKVLRDEAQSVLNLKTNLMGRIRGQDHAILALSEVLESSKSGLTNANEPLGVFLLVGPSGVGKTETALSIADLLFGGEQSMVTINMSEFQEKHTVSRLIGSPPGYVGYGEGGVLTEAVRQRPYSVVLLDEVEKAHIEVLELFYQVFDKGTLSDGEGRVIDFKNTVIILTSNLATDVITEMTKGDDTPPMDVVMGAVRPILSNHFKPALLARMTAIPYYTLPPDFMKEITTLKLGKLVGRMMTNNKMKLTYSQAVVDQIAERCVEIETGARNIDFIMRGTVMPMMAKKILAYMSEGEMPAQVHLDVTEAGEFSVSFDGVES